MVPRGRSLRRHERDRIDHGRSLSALRLQDEHPVRARSDARRVQGASDAPGPLAPGTYPLRAHVLIADDSADGYTPIDANESLVIDCTVATATPTPKSTEGGGVGPTQGHATPPGGTVGGVRGTPRVTLPPTDTGNGMIPGDQSLGVRAVLIGMAALACALLVL